MLLFMMENNHPSAPLSQIPHSKIFENMFCDSLAVELLMQRRIILHEAHNTQDMLDITQGIRSCMVILF